MMKVIDWLTLYNYKRLHSMLGYVSPMTFEQTLDRCPAARQEVRIMAYGVRTTGARSYAPSQCLS